MHLNSFKCHSQQKSITKHDSRGFQKGENKNENINEKENKVKQ